MGRKSDQVARAAEPLMEPGEVVEVAAMATVGKMNVAKTAAIAAVTAIATLGTVSVMVTPKPQPVVLSTKRLLVLGMKVGLIDKPDSKITAQMARSELRARPAKRVMLYHQVDLTDLEAQPVARLKFSFFDRSDAERFAHALGEPPQVATAKR
jgi:hypothetical protein